MKRQLIHVGAFNLSLILRKLLGAGTPREWKNRFGRLVLTLYLLFMCRINQKRPCRSRSDLQEIRYLQPGLLGCRYCGWALKSPALRQFVGFLFLSLCRILRILCDVL